MQGIGIVSVLNQLVGNLLSLLAGTAEDDAINLRIIVGNALQGIVLIFGMNHVGNVVHVLGSFVLHADGDFLRILQVLLGDATDFGTHRGREHQCVAVSRHFLEDGIDAFGEAHVQHFVGFVHHHVDDVVELRHATFHEVDKASRSGHDDVNTRLEHTDLAFDGRTAIHGQYLQSVDVFRIIVQVAGYLQTKFAGRAEDECLRYSMLYVCFLDKGQTEGSRLSGAGLSKGYHVVSFAEQIRNHFFLYRHGTFVSHFFNGLAYFGGNAQFFKCLHSISF